MDLKEQKVPKQVYKRRRVDWISRLPDALLHHIFSFLPIEEAVTTSILSTRWRYVWTSIPVLNFEFSPTYPPNPTRAMKFMNFVDKFLLGHDMNIKRFSLSSINFQIDESRANAWISNVIRHNVQELKLIVHVEEHPFIFPPNLLTCESLVTLLMAGSTCILKLPTSTCFSRLKILGLVFVKFSDDYSTQQLFSNCPLLEYLILDHCRWENLKIFNIWGPVLKMLDIYGLEEWYDEEVGLSDSIIKIYAPNLLYLTYSCCLSEDYIQCNFSSLIDAKICVATKSYSRRSDAELGYCASKLLGSLSNVKVLEISGETFEMLSNAKDLLTHLPVFHNLIRLEVNTNLRYSSGRALLDLLQVSPNLKYLVFAGELVTDKQCWIFEKVPQCLSLHLKQVKFEKFVGDEAEFCVLKFLLKNAIVLERMIITNYCSSKDPKKKLEIAKQLLMIPRASTNSVIEFS